MKNIFILIFISTFFIGCAQKVNVKMIEPANIQRAADVKKIAVLRFKNDSIGFASKLETQLSKKTVLGSQYFTVMNREEIDKIIDEQKLQYSGLVDEKTAVKVGKLIGVQGIISGTVADSSMNRNYYRTLRSKCIDKECKRSRTYYVSCTRTNYNLSVNIKLTDVQFGDIIYADSISQDRTYSNCVDRLNNIPTKGYVLDKLSDTIVQRFISKISPNKRYVSIELLDSPEIDYTDEQEKLLEYSLQYIKNGRLDKAEELLSNLLTSTKDKCFVAAYNLGLVKEAQGEYSLAKQLYEQADDLVLEPNEAIDKAILRIKEQITNNKIVKEQVQN